MIGFGSQPLAIDSKRIVTQISSCIEMGYTPTYILLMEEILHQLGWHGYCPIFVGVLCLSQHISNGAGFLSSKWDSLKGNLR